MEIGLHFSAAFNWLQQFDAETLRKKNVLYIFQVITIFSSMLLAQHKYLQFL